MDADDEIPSVNRPFVEMAQQLRAISYQVSKLNEDLVSIKSDIGATKLAVSKIPTAKSDASSSVFFASILLALIIALTSNPLKSTHVTHLMSRIPGDSDADKAAKKLTSDYILPHLAPNLLSYESYYFCSVTKLKLDDTEIPLTFGIFGNVFDYGTPEEVKEKLDKLRE